MSAAASNRDHGTEAPRIAHVVPGGAGTRGLVTGDAVSALCGTVFVPSRTGDGLPVCTKCLDAYLRVMQAMHN